MRTFSFPILQFSISFVFLLIVKTGAAQPLPVNIAEVDSLMQVTPRPVLIMLSADWCHICDLQKHLLQKNKNGWPGSRPFYFTILNAEDPGEIMFNKKLFRHQVAGEYSGIHQLATALSGSVPVAFPGWILLNNKYELLFRHRGLLTAKQLRALSEAVN